MDDVLLNGCLKIPVPEGFRVLDREELRQMYLDDLPDRWGMRNEEEHIIVCVYWHKFNRLLKSIADPKEVCKADEKRISKVMKNNGYAFESYFDTEVAGIKACGFRYNYEVQGIPQVCEVTVLIRDNVTYTLYFYTRPECAEKARGIYGDIVGRISFR